MVSFLDLCRSGQACSEAVDSAIAEWHQNPHGVSLAQHLGMTPAEYAEFVINPDILDKLLQTSTIEKLEMACPHVSSPVGPGEGLLALIADLPLGTVVLLADLQSRNKGASMTNVIEKVISYVSTHAIRDRVGAFLNAFWVELDSEGALDRVTFQGSAEQPQSVQWSRLPAGENLMVMRTFGDALRNHGLRTIDLLESGDHANMSLHPHNTPPF